MSELSHRLAVDKVFEQTFPDSFKFIKEGDYPVAQTAEDFDCYRNLISQYSEKCGEPDTYTMKYFGAFLHQCKAIRYYPAALDDFQAKLTNACVNMQKE